MDVGCEEFLAGIFHTVVKDKIPSAFDLVGLPLPFLLRSISAIKKIVRVHYQMNFIIYPQKQIVVSIQINFQCPNFKSSGIHRLA